MHCSLLDGELKEYVVRAVSNLPITYWQCPTCGGHWLEGFAVNYIKSLIITSQPLSSVSENPASPQCPQCQKSLELARGENIPPEVVVWHCPAGHGYFFPAGELLRFKKAQEAKLAYFKLWQIPLASVASTLLMFLVGLILSGGLVLSVIEGQREQNLVSQAAEVISSQHAYISPQSRSVTIVAITTITTSLTLNVPLLKPAAIPMPSFDGRSHVVRLTNLAKGNYVYYFSFGKDGRTSHSAKFSFQIP